MSSNSAGSMGNSSPSLLEIRSINRELMADSGPPVLPSSFPRRPARGGQTGVGWPYAPQGWPNRDDKWPWRVGKRVRTNGNFRDRYLRLPKGLCKGRKLTEFASKESTVEYLKKNFPDIIVENFFKSFQWRIPCVKGRNPYSAGANAFKRRRPEEEERILHASGKRLKKECRAGNPDCGLESGRSFLRGNEVALTCNVCCTEPGFCMECKCILCCKTITPELGESNFIRCRHKPSGDGICGHAAHLECALRSTMAGVVKRRSLDMEYLCRRCDKKTDLRELVTLLLEMVGNTDQRTQAEKSLKLALEIMKGTEHGGGGARVLEALVQTALRKIQSGVDIQEVFHDLKDQGAAAEAAKQQNVVRGVSLLEDVPQQPEASLDQWLPSSGSPSSHPSPGTPSSFTSPLVRSNASVNSGQLNGIKYVDGSVGKHNKRMASEGHADHVGDARTSPEVYSNSNYKHSHLANKSLITNAGQVRGSHRVRAVSSNVYDVHETICDSHTARTTGMHVAEPGLRDGNSAQWVNHNSNSGQKNQYGQRSPSAAAGLHREDSTFTEICRSCGAVRRHPNNAVEVTSSRRFPKIEDGGRKTSKHSLALREHEQGDSDYKHIQESDTRGNWRDRPSSTFSANGNVLTVMGTSLNLLDSQCQQDVQVALQKLRQSQDAEFECAKQRLTAQRESIVRQYELLEVARSEFSEQSFSSSLEAYDDLLQKIARQFARATEERENFKAMLKVADGFGSVSKDHLTQFFGWPLEG